MIKDFAKVNWKIFREWRKKHRDNQTSKANSKREQSIGILRKRYGYTKEKAAAELDEHYPKAKLC
jgi:hypothetical protein